MQWKNKEKLTTSSTNFFWGTLFTKNLNIKNFKIKNQGSKLVQRYFLGKPFRTDSDNSTHRIFLQQFQKELLEGDCMVAKMVLTRGGKGVLIREGFILELKLKFLSSYFYLKMIWICLLWPEIKISWWRWNWENLEIIMKEMGRFFSTFLFH